MIIKRRTNLVTLLSEAAVDEIDGASDDADEDDVSEDELKVESDVLLVEGDGVIEGNTQIAGVCRIDVINEGKETEVLLRKVL